MKLSVSEPESWKRVLEFEIEPKEVETAFEEMAAVIKRRICLPGFRPGKVPLHVVRSRFGPEIRAEAIDTIIQKYAKDACKERGILPVGPLHVSSVIDEEGTPLRFTIETEVDPPLEIKGYDKLKIKVNPRKIKNSDVEDAIENLRERLADFIDVNRPTVKGDYVELEYRRVVVEGEEKKDINSPAYPIEVGASSIKDFDKGLVGLRPGETAEIGIRFPADYGDEMLAGKKAQLSILVKSVKEKRLPDVNEEFCRKWGNFSSVEEFRRSIEEGLQKRENERARREACERAVDILLEKNRFEVPPSRIERYLDRLHEELVRQIKPPAQPPSRQETGAKYRSLAEHVLRRWRLISYIAEKENISATPEEVDAEIRKYAERNEVPFDKLKETMLNSNAISQIEAEIRERKTLSFLIKEDVSAGQEQES